MSYTIGPIDWTSIAIPRYRPEKNFHERKAARIQASADSDAKTLPPPRFWPGYLHSYEGGYHSSKELAKELAPGPAPARCECGSNEPNCHSDWCPLSCR